MLSDQGRKSIKKASAGAECGSVSLRRVINLKRDPSLRTPGNRSTTISDIKRRILLSAPRNPAAGATTRQGRSASWPEATGHRGQVPGGPREALRGPRRSPKTSHAAAHLGSLTPCLLLPTGERCVEDPSELSRGAGKKCPVSRGPHVCLDTWRRLSNDSSFLKRHFLIFQLQQTRITLVSGVRHSDEAFT